MPGPGFKFLLQLEAQVAPSQASTFIAFRVKPTHSLRTTTQGWPGGCSMYTSTLCLIPTGMAATAVPVTASETRRFHSLAECDEALRLANLKQSKA